MGANRKFSEAEKQFMRDNCKTMIVAEMERQMGWSKTAIRNFLKGEGLQQTKELTAKLRLNLEAQRSSVTPEQDKVIQEEYLTTPVKTLATKIGRSQELVRTRLKQLGLVIPPEIIKKRKLDSQKKAGDVPPNKGLKQEEYMSPATIERTKATRFKPGQKPKNTVEVIGTVRVRHNKKRKIKSVWILIDVKTWKELHRYNWEAVNGPVPEGFLLRFKDGNTLNCEVDNLELTSKEDHMRLNTIHNLPDDLKEVIMIKGRIKRQINKHLKNDR